MTTPTPRSTPTLETELRTMYAPQRVPAPLSQLIDDRITAAMRAARPQPARSRRRSMVLAAAASLVVILTLAGVAVAQRLGAACGTTIVDGISVSDCVEGHPGLTNFGQPFWGSDIFERSPSDAAEMAAQKGYAIRWLIEDRAGTATSDDNETRFSDEPPPCGRLEAGGVIDSGHIQMVVVVNDPSTPDSAC